MVKIVLSLIFADKCDLGWDPTVNAKYDGGKRLLEFEVSGKHYRTSSNNTLSDHRARGVHTSANRIFKAFRIDDKDRKYPVVIKDFWLEEEDQAEDVIRSMILDDISDAEERDTVLSMTLTPVASGRVKVRGEEDHTEKTILRGKSPLKKHIIKAQNRMVVGGAGFRAADFGIRKQKKGGIGQDAGRQLEDNRRTAHHHRWHYRIVYKEYAIPYDKLDNLDDMLLVLECAVKGECGLVQVSSVPELSQFYRLSTRQDGCIETLVLVIYTYILIPIVGRSEGLLGILSLQRGSEQELSLMVE